MPNFFIIDLKVTLKNPMTDQTTAQAVAAAINNVSTDQMLAETAAKGIEASAAAANRVRDMLATQLSTANFNLVSDLNDKFAGFIRYDEIRERLDFLLEEASRGVSGTDVRDSLNDAMEDIHEITGVLNPAGSIHAGAKFFGRIARAFRHGFKSQRQIFVFGIKDLQGKVKMVEQVIGTEKEGIKNTVELVRTYLPAVTEDVVRLEYLARFLEEFIKTENAKDLGQDAQTFLRDYLVAVQTMKQVSAVSILRVLMGLNRIVKAKFHLDKVEMKFSMNLGTLVFENLIANQIHTAYSVAESIELGVESLEEKNKSLDKANRDRELAEKEKQLDILKSLGGKLEQIQADYDQYRADLQALNDEVDAFMPEYNKAYDQLIDMRDAAMAREAAAAAAMHELLKSDAWNEEAVIQNHKKHEAERKQAAEEVMDLAK